MDKKVIAIVAVVAVVAIAAVCIFAMQPKGGDDSSSDTIEADILVKTGGTITADQISGVLTDEFDRTVVLFGIESDSTSAEVNISADALGVVKDAKKGFGFVTKDGTAKILSRGVSGIVDLGGDLTFKVLITKDSSEIIKKLGSKDYSEVRAYAELDVYKGTTKSDVSKEVIFEVPYKLNDEYFEASENALQWDENLVDSQCICSDKSATLTANTGKPVYLAFMNKDDVLYYPVTYQMMVNGVAVDQTLNHKPVKVAAFWDNTVELALLFGLKDRIAFAFTELDYECVNP